jgi:hypothetical protein
MLICAFADTRLNPLGYKYLELSMSLPYRIHFTNMNFWAKLSSKISFKYFVLHTNLTGTTNE